MDAVENHDESPPHDLVLGSQSDDADITLTEDRDQSNVLSVSCVLLSELTVLFQCSVFWFILCLFL